MALCFGRTRTLLLLALLALPPASVPPATAQPASRTFPETGHTVSGSFLSFWQSHGGLTQLGYPISDPLIETSDTDGQPYTVQYFERAVLESHPENAGTPFEVLPSLLGDYRYREYYGPDGAPDQHASSEAPRYFPQTGHTVGGFFRRYWEAHGGLAQQGYPISDEFTEVSDLDNKPYTVQYFERAAFELHPENAGTPYEVLLTQLGTYQQRTRYGTVTLPPPAEQGLAQGGPVGSNTYLAWIEDSPYSEHPNEKLYAVDVRNSQHTKPIAANRSVVYLSYSVSGSTIVWADGNGAVLGEDLDTGITFTIALGDFAPTIVGRTVAWFEDSGPNTRLVMKDLDTNTTSVVASARPAGYGIAVSDEYFAWTEYGAGLDCDLHYLRRSTGQVQTAAQQTTGQCALFGSSILSGHYLVWADSPNPTLLINLDTGATTPLPGGKGSSAAIRGNTVVWTAYAGGLNGEVWGMKLTDRIPMRLLGPRAGGYRRVAIAGDWLIVSEGRNLTAHRLADLFTPVHK
ncbi:MAG: hypothetical protein ACR2M0_09130 [Chloroflexia bacterium]